MKAWFTYYGAELRNFISGHRVMSAMAAVIVVLALYAHFK